MLSSAASSPPPDDLVRDADYNSFMHDVIEASLAKPVIVDFWMSGSQPCKQLMTVLEKLVRAMQGAVRLVKINIDANPEIAAQFRVQSVPSVFAVFQGQPIDAFVGMKSEAQIRQWIERIVALTGGAANAANPLAQIEAAQQQAEEHLAAGDWQAAQDMFGEILGVAPDHAAAYAGVIRSMVAGGHKDQAQAMLDAAPETIAKDKAMDQARAALELAAETATAGNVQELALLVEAQPDNHQARYDWALALLAAGQRGECVDQLLEIIRRQRGWNEEAARKQLVKLFEIFGPIDPLTISARKRLSSILFA